MDQESTQDKSGVVYELRCNECSASYIGETEKPLKTRIMEHHRDSSPVAAHSKHHHHSIDYEHVKVMDREQAWFRGVKEALHIEARGANLNRDKGHHHLVPGYKTLIHSYVPLLNRRDLL